MIIFTQEFKPYSKQIIRINDKKDNVNCLLIGINTKIENVKAIILSGHIDTVPANMNYSVDPFSITIKNGNAYGLGIIDMKCYFSTILKYIKDLKELSVPIIVAVTSDEETNLESIKSVIKYLKWKNVIPIVSIIGEPTNLNICTFSRGCYEYCVSVIGKSAHSSNPQAGVNACYILAKIVGKLEEMSLLYEDTTINCGVICGGSAVNIVPDEAKLQFDIRTLSGANVQDIINNIKLYFKDLENEYIGSSIDIKNTLIIPELEKQTNFIIDKFIQENNLKEEEFKAASEAGYFTNLGGSSILFGAGDLSLAHKADEFLNLER